MKKFFVGALALFFLFSCVKKASAQYTEWSDYIHPTAEGSYYTQWTNPSYVYDDPDSLYAEKNMSTSTTYRQTYKAFGLPTGVIPTSIQIKVKIKRQDSFGGLSLGVNVLAGDTIYTTDSLGVTAGYLCTGSVYASQTLPADTSEHTYEFYFSNNDPTHTCVTDFFTNYGWDPAAGLFIVANVSNGSNAQTVRIYDLTVRITYEPVTSISMDSYISSPSAQAVYATFSGTTAYAGDNVDCRINLFEKCSADGQADFGSEAPIAVFKLDPEGTNTVTEDLGGGYYLPYGYSASHSGWTAENIPLPYHPGATCHYPMQTLCTEAVVSCNSETPPICVYTDTIVHVNETDEGLSREVVMDQLFTEPEPSDPLQWIVWKLKKTFWEFFGWNAPEINNNFFGVRNELAQRAPFAYVYPIFDLGVSDPTTTSAAPAITLDVPNTGDIEGYEITYPQPVLTMFSYIRWGLALFLGAAFLYYLFAVARRIF